MRCCCVCQIKQNQKQKTTQIDTSTKNIFSSTSVIFNCFYFIMFIITLDIQQQKDNIFQFLNFYLNIKKKKSVLNINHIKTFFAIPNGINHLIPVVVELLLFQLLLNLNQQMSEKRNTNKSGNNKLVSVRMMFCKFKRSVSITLDDNEHVK